MSLGPSLVDESNEAIVSTLLAHLPETAKPEHFQGILPKFSSQLKSNFENRNLWLRFGLTLSLSKEAPQSALQAFNECMRIDQDDPLPAMLAAKILLEDLNDPERALNVAQEAIKRCMRLSEQLELRYLKPIDKDDDDDDDDHDDDGDGEDGGKEKENINGLHEPSPPPPPPPPPLAPPKENGHGGDSEDVATTTTTTTTSITTTPTAAATVIKALKENRSCYYKQVAPLLSRSYILASIAHARMYEREPESIKNSFMETHLKLSLELLDQAAETNPNDYLIYFHKALHEAKQRTYPKAIDNLRRAIQINPQHLPSMQLLILSLSALKLYEDALTLCESILDEHPDDLLLLYIKCNLEQNLVETKGYKVALGTAQHMLKCMRQSVNQSNNMSEHGNYSSTTTISATTQQAAIHNGQHHQQQHLTNNQSSSLSAPEVKVTTTSGSSTSNSTTLISTSTTMATMMPSSATSTLATTTTLAATASIAGSTLMANSATNASSTPQTTSIPISLSNPTNDSNKQKSNLFADSNNGTSRKQDYFQDGELSVWILVAEIFVKIGAVEDAEMCVDEGSIHANGALSHQVMFIRGLIAKAKNHLMEAKTFFQSCMALCPRHAKALQQIAHVYYMMGNYPTAEKFLKDALDLDCDCHKTWYYLSLVYIEMNQHDRASECVKKSTSLEESSPVVAFSTISRLTLK